MGTIKGVRRLLGEAELGFGIRTLSLRCYPLMERLGVPGCHGGGPV